MNKLYVAKIVNSTSVDGVGLRHSVYVSGCNLHCPGCHNQYWWSLESGQAMSIEEVYQMLTEDDCNISILGGEPLMQYPAVLELCRMIKQRTHKTVWLWTGYEIAHVQQRYSDLLSYVDVIVDGAYKADLRDTTLSFRGSRNQRIYAINHTDNSVCDISSQFDTV